LSLKQQPHLGLPSQSGIITVITIHGAVISRAIYIGIPTHLGDIQGYLQMETHSTITCTPCY